MVGEGEDAFCRKNEKSFRATSPWESSGFTIHISHPHIFLSFPLDDCLPCVFAGLLVLMSDLFWLLLPHAPLSVAPLLFMRAAYLGFQALVQPKPLDLLKAFLVSAAFFLWGIDQLLSPGRFATTLGDVIITLYVLDLGWTLLGHLIQRKGTLTQIGGDSENHK